jgi:hypothetical protein
LRCFLGVFLQDLAPKNVLNSPRKGKLNAVLVRQQILFSKKDGCHCVNKTLGDQLFG